MIKVYLIKPLSLLKKYQKGIGMIKSKKKYHRSELAKQQLKTAVALFLNEKDLSSVITLSAASSTILSQLVRNSGKEPFIDYACRFRLPDIVSLSLQYYQNLDQDIFLIHPLEKKHLYSPSPLNLPPPKYFGNRHYRS